jgi:superfamily II DNA or RNA helicase
MLPAELKPSIIVRGPVLPEPVAVIAVTPFGDAVKVVGRGVQSNLVHDRILTAAQIAQLVASPEKEPFDGDAKHFRLGIEALRLALAFEYDPYFTLSIARVDPLPHQLEAVYDYFLRLPRIRFLLADDPGAGKTIMAGLLIKELKIRGLVRRILIVSPANLTFQWQREMKDKFREKFEVVRGDILRANYGQNPWQEKNQVVTSISWISHIDDARESLMRSEWDLVIVDEAHKMAAYSRDKKTQLYVMGEQLADRTDHFLMMTATPHKGDPDNFCLFLELLDRDVYGDVKSLQEAMRRNNAPFYLRRIKEALVTFPDAETGQCKKLFTNREVQTVGFEIDDEELDFYFALTKYVEDQTAKAEDNARGRALTFTMAMLQRRFASSVYAVRRSLERMRDKRQKILDDPEAYMEEQRAKYDLDNMDDMEDDERHRIEEKLEAVVASIEPAKLREEIAALDKLIVQARLLEQGEVESKLVKLKNVLTEQGIFSDPKHKLLLFTEHKDTLDYLVGKLRSWGLVVTQIHGGMKIGDRDVPDTRLHAEVQFRDQAQVLVATEAAGEGINLQFCWFMINYDIPWNPVRLEQRMGRIHRYGQTHDCLILNFVSVKTREGRVLQKLLDRLKEIRAELGTDRVFDVVGEIFPANRLEKLFRDLYAQKTKVPDIEAQIVHDIDRERIAHITNSTLEGLAKKELNLGAIIGKSAEAKERRLVPEVIEDFFLGASDIAGVYPKEIRGKPHHYRVEKVPKTLAAVGERLEPKYGRLDKAYKQIIFDKAHLTADATSEWVTPGHPLFEAVRAEVETRTQDDLRRGAVFYDLHRADAYRLDVFSASIGDGQGHCLVSRLFVVEAGQGGALSIRQPTIFLDLATAPIGTPAPSGDNLPGLDAIEQTLVDKALAPMLGDMCLQRAKEIRTVEEHIEISLNALINRQNVKMASFLGEQAAGDSTSPVAANIKNVEDRLDELNGRLERRREELKREIECSIGDIRHLGRAWVLPHPERAKPEFAPMVRDDEVERIAVEAAIKFEQARGWTVESVEKDNRGFDLISRKLHPEDPKTAVAVRFIEVKGRAAVGDVALTSNEYKTAQRLKEDFWLYVVYNCCGSPELHPIQDPAKLGWDPIVKVEHYAIRSAVLLEASK